MTGLPQALWRARRLGGGGQRESVNHRFLDLKLRMPEGFV